VHLLLTVTQASHRATCWASTDNVIRPQQVYALLISSVLTAAPVSQGIMMAAEALMSSDWWLCSSAGYYSTANSAAFVSEDYDAFHRCVFCDWCDLSVLCRCTAIPIIAMQLHSDQAACHSTWARVQNQDYPEPARIHGSQPVRLNRIESAVFTRPRMWQEASRKYTGRNPEKIDLELY
jgi:hypothetical protein